MANRDVYIYLKDNEMKGRLIGREGRNARTFEEQSGIELFIDDNPHWIILKGKPDWVIDAVEVMKALLEDGRVHPTRIQELFRPYLDKDPG